MSPDDEATESPEVLAENEEVVAGRRPVSEAFAAHRPALRLLVVPERRLALEQLVLHATAMRIPVVEVEGGTLTSVTGFDGHQGIALVVEPRRWASLDDVLARAAERKEPPLVLVLDSLEDPQNVGTLLRTAEAIGVHGVLFPTRRAAPMSPAAVKASAGATEHLLLVPLDDLPSALADLHGRGLRIVGADEDASLAYRDADLRGPLALVVGSEGQGISGPIHRRLDLAVRIPMRGRIGSLNASVAGSVLLFEAAAQRGLGDGEKRRADQPASWAEQPSADEPTTADGQVANGPEAATTEAAAPEVEAPKPRRTATRARKTAEATPAEATPTPRTRARRTAEATPAPTTRARKTAATTAAPATPEPPTTAKARPKRATRSTKAAPPEGSPSEGDSELLPEADLGAE
jgi:23S rRNA (guanosine2251-2'-O)-methyltransferase